MGFLSLLFGGVINLLKAYWQKGTDDKVAEGRAEDRAEVLGSTVEAQTRQAQAAADAPLSLAEVIQKQNDGKF
jgi:hypothetical protein